MIHRFHILAVISGILAWSGPAQNLGGCSIFSPNNVWNTPVDKLPVHASSAQFVSTIGASSPLHPDFGTVYNGAPAGIPYVLVKSSQPKVPVTFRYAADSDPGPYPIPANAPIEGGPSSTGDRHVLVLETDNCILYEVFSAYPQTNGSWQAGSGAIFNLKSNNLRPAGETSADAAGLPMLPGLVRYDEVLAGVINHAIRFTVPKTRNSFVWPARHYASTYSAANYPPMGTRFRLKAGYDISAFPKEEQVILTALKKYGLIIADNGGAWFISGVPDMRWNDNNLHLLTKVLGSNFEAVDESGLMVSSDSGQVQSVVVSNLAKLVAGPTQVVSGNTSTSNLIYLTGAAGSGGTSVSLSTSNPAVLSVPPVVIVPAGSSSVRFTATAGIISVPEVVTMSAFSIGVTQTAPVTVLPATLSHVVTYGLPYSSGNGRVDLNGLAPAGGVVVYLSSSDTAIMTVPPSVTVPAGARSVLFPVHYSGHGTATLTAHSGAVTEIYTFSR